MRGVAFLGDRQLGARRRLLLEVKRTFSYLDSQRAPDVARAEHRRRVREDVMRWIIAMGLSAVSLVFVSGLAWTAGQYGPGAGDTEIKIGNTMPYSGSASSYGVIGKSEAAYFAMINELGGIKGRKITFISRDDGYSPAKTVEQVRKMVEEDGVLLLFQTLGTPSNTAIQGYLTDNKVPQLFVATGADKWNDPKNHPWTMGWQPSYRIEARIYARYILQTQSDAKIAVLYQNDDFGRDYLVGLRDGLGDKADQLIVASQSYETTDPTVDPQILSLQGSGANVLLTAATPKFAAQAIRKVYDIGWKPTHFLSNVSISVGAVMQPAALEKGVGIISAGYLKDPTGPQWQDTPEYKEWLAWMTKYNSSANVRDSFTIYGYSGAQTLVAVLKASGAKLAREALPQRTATLPRM